MPSIMDHLVVAMIMDAAGEDPAAVEYVAYDAGGRATAGLLSGEIAALSTGSSEAVQLAACGEVKIIGLTARERVDALPDAMMMAEQGLDVQFVNWRRASRLRDFPRTNWPFTRLRSKQWMTSRNGQPYAVVLAL